MASKHLNPRKEAVGGASNNQLRRSAAMDPLHGIGHLSSLNPENRSHGAPLSSAYLQQVAANMGTNRSNPPPLPPRLDGTYMSRSRYSAMNGYSGIGGYGMGSGMGSYYSPYSPSRYSPGLYSSGLYSPYSNYRMPYGPYGAPNNSYNSFLQMAEESTRPAFESIESVVHVVNSISMMLESTYGAVHSSYSAILGVVDQFSRLKDHLAQMFSILAMLRGLHWLCLKVLYLLGLRKTNPSVEDAWRTAHKAATTGVYPPESRGSAWPFFMFLSLVIGAPWLMFKLLSKNAAKVPSFDPNMWVTPEGKRYVVYAGYDFNATQPGELSFRAGDKLTLSPKDMEDQQSGNKNWLLACNEQNESGLVPMNYLLTSSSLVPNGARKFAAQSAAARNNFPHTSAFSEQYNRNYGFAGPDTQPNQSKHHIYVPPNGVPSSNRPVSESDSNKPTDTGDAQAQQQDGANTSEKSSASDKDSVSVPNFDSLKKNLILPEDLNFGEVPSPVNNKEENKAEKE